MSFIIHADFEARTEKIQTCSPEQNQSHTEAYQNTQIVGMFIKLFVFMMRNLTNLCRRKCCLQVYGKDD